MAAADPEFEPLFRLSVRARVKNGEPIFLRTSHGVVVRTLSADAIVPPLMRAKVHSSVS